MIVGFFYIWKKSDVIDDVFLAENVYHKIRINRDII